MENRAKIGMDLGGRKGATSFVGEFDPRAPLSAVIL